MVIIDIPVIEISDTSSEGTENALVIKSKPSNKPFDVEGVAE